MPSHEERPPMLMSAKSNAEGFIAVVQSRFVRLSVPCVRYFRTGVLRTAVDMAEISI